jgi:hypothetical protein
MDIKEAPIESLCHRAAARIRELEAQSEDWTKIICEKDQFIRDQKERVIRDVDRLTRSILEFS